MSYYLGCYFGRDDDSALHFAPIKLIETMVDYYYNMIGSKPKYNFP